jgi:tetratricopeptide (TPR) repeat protein
VVRGRTRAAAWVARSSTSIAVGGSIAIGATLVAAPAVATVAIVAAVPAFFAARKLAAWELGRLPDYHADAHARGDADALAGVRRIWTNIGAKGPRASALAKMLEAEELALREKWKEARDAFRAVDRTALPAVFGPSLKNWNAYTTARAGEPLAALAIVGAALAETHADDPNRPSLEQTRARILVLLGRAHEALPFFEEAVKEAVHDRALNQRYYWLGVANDGAGNDDAARVAYERAAALEGPYQDKARAALGGRTPFRG